MTDQVFSGGANNPLNKIAKPLPDVATSAKIIAVGSGKGGVGKSTVTGLCAVALARAGYKVGVLDADITGPSMPKVLGISDPPLTQGDGYPIIPPVSKKYGIGVMSLSLVMDDNSQPVAWRGPLISSMLKQFWEDVDWGGVDVLLIDLPPGTADSPITVMQMMFLSGLLSVTTPQSLSATIVQKQAKLAKMLNVPLLGVVENMSYMEVNGQRIEPFGPSHRKEVEDSLNIKTIAQIPLDPELCRLADNGLLEEYENDLLFEQLVQALRP